jgi:hypothetical protein
LTLSHSIPDQESILARQEVWIAVAVLLLFAILQAAAYTLSPADSFLESDTADYLTAARALVATGSFTSEFRLPGYPVFIGAALLTTRGLGFAIALQALLLLMTAGIYWAIGERIVPRSGLPTLILVCFNPAAAFYVQQILPETLFTFFLALNVYFVLQTCRTGSTAAALSAGLAAGGTAMIRGNGQFVIWITPIAMFAGYAVLHRNALGRPAFKMVAWSVMAAYLVCAPWLVHNWTIGEGISFVPRAYSDLAIHDNVVRAVALERRVPVSEARLIVDDVVRQKGNVSPSLWEGFTQAEKYRLVASHAGDILWQSGVADLGRAMTACVARFFFVNEGQTWATFWQLPGTERLDPEVTSRYSLTRTLRRSPGTTLTTYVCHAVTLVMLVGVRLLAIVGLVYLVRQRLWYVLMVFASYVAAFTISAGFIAYSRYRVPVDPMLMLIAAIGVVTGRRVWSRPAEMAPQATS